MKPLRLIRFPLLLILFSGITAACAAPQVTQSEMSITLSADGVSQEFKVPAGTTVQEALDFVSLTMSTLDRVEPPGFTLLTEGTEVRVIRVEEEFSVEQVVIPFEQQILRNESLPEGERRLIQPGINGVQEITNRRVFEDGVEVSNSPVKTVIVEDAIPEIVMVGSQSPFASIPITGRLAYISAGNAWVMEGSTGIRRPVVTTGDLDGRIFHLSPDGEWLLFTRNEEAEEMINSLWVAALDETEDVLIDLEVQNVIHFADWSPRSSQTLAYSTVEPRSTAPGWQANNDLHVITFSANGWISRRSQPLEANSGGLYGWWGSSYAWAPDGRQIAIARPDGVGLLDLRDEEIISLLEITPLQTNSDWAWVPGLAWGPAGNIVFTVDHAPPQGVESVEESPFFDLAAVSLQGGPPLAMISDVGMFAYPSPSPLLDPDSEQVIYQVAFLQAIFPNQSETSRYRLMVMDRDGSNRRVLFPPEGAPGIEPQTVVWSPTPLPTNDVTAAGGFALALVYQENLWLVDPQTGDAWQLTGDNLVRGVDWH